MMRAGLLAAAATTTTISSASLAARRRASSRLVSPRHACDVPDAAVTGTGVAGLLRGPRRRTDPLHSVRYQQ